MPKTIRTAKNGSTLDVSESPSHCLRNGTAPNVWPSSRTSVEGSRVTPFQHLHTLQCNFSIPFCAIAVVITERRPLRLYCEHSERSAVPKSAPVQLRRAPFPDLCCRSGRALTKTLFGKCRKERKKNCLKRVSKLLFQKAIYAKAKAALQLQLTVRSKMPSGV
jgi:hypothetical protein